MAGDWIKMRTDLYRDPKVCIMADALGDDRGPLASYVNQMCHVDMAVTRNVMRNVTVGALVTVWGVTRHRGKRDGDDLVIRGARLEVIDDIADLPGFGDAMKLVGWAIESPEGLRFPKFFEEFNNDPSEDAKQKNAERQRRYREKSNALRNVTVTSQSNARVEKRREEKNIVSIRVAEPHCHDSDDRSDDVPLEPIQSKPKQAYSDDFERFWEIYPAYRRRDKGNAWKAWVKALKVVSAAELIERAEDYAASPVGRGEFSKLPASWLNARGWEDDPKSWGSAPEQRPRIPTAAELLAYNPNG